MGAEVSYHDPHIPEAPAMRSWPELPSLKSTSLNEDTLQALDAAIIITDHERIDYSRIADHVPLVIDTRRVFKESRTTVVKA
jgi:UDP-N-acetyl-D-glucosamine dehydrogenase